MRKVKNVLLSAMAFYMVTNTIGFEMLGSIMQGNRVFPMPTIEEKEMVNMEDFMGTYEPVLQGANKY